MCFCMCLFFRTVLALQHTCIRFCGMHMCQHVCALQIGACTSTHHINFSRVHMLRYVHGLHKGACVSSNQVCFSRMPMCLCMCLSFRTVLALQHTCIRFCGMHMLQHVCALQISACASTHLILCSTVHMLRSVHVLHEEACVSSNQLFFSMVPMCFCMCLSIRTVLALQHTCIRFCGMHMIQHVCALQISSVVLLFCCACAATRHIYFRRVHMLRCVHVLQK
jgi:hypothetical protein